jgi:protein-tyrosine phosphatase
LTNYGLKYDVDFRTKKEITDTPDKVPAGCKYEWTPVFSEDLTNSSKGIDDLETVAQNDAHWGYNHMLFAYEDMIVSDSAKKAYRHFFDLLLANDQPGESLAFHCTAGKDRTGYAGLLILHVLGVPEDTIIADYLLTNETIADFVQGMLDDAKKAGNNDNVLQAITDIQTVHKSYLTHAIDVLNDKFGGIDAYLHNELHLTPAEEEKLREIYLED